MQLLKRSSKNSMVVTFVKGQRVVACDPEDGFFYPGELHVTPLNTSVTFLGSRGVENGAESYCMEL